MGLFGLSTSEAILLTRQLNAEQERRKNETLRAINQQQAALEQQSEADCIYEERYPGRNK